MIKMVIMGSGASPGVPAIANGWGSCNPDNPKNRRRRAGTWLESSNARILIDTSPDVRTQLLDNHIRAVDAVLYTHSHADHLHGIDDLRDLNRVSGSPVDAYASKETSAVIRQRFSYLIADGNKANSPLFVPSIILHELNPGEEFTVGGLHIRMLPLSGHAVPSNGYVFNDGQIVYVSDCRGITPEGLSLIKRRPELLVLPLTTIMPHRYHMGLDKVLEYVNILKPHKTIINHMAVECDYDNIMKLTPENVLPAYDNMSVEI